MPHGRHDCLQYRFGEGKNASICGTCYCYMCDVLASECKSWEGNHCDATPADTKWLFRKHGLAATCLGTNAIGCKVAKKPVSTTKHYIQEQSLIICPMSASTPEGTC